MKNCRKKLFKDFVLCEKNKESILTDKRIYYFKDKLK